MVVGDSPWKDEVRTGKPFAGAAGYVFNRWLSLIGIERDTLTVTNTIWYPPPYLGWSDKWAHKPSSNPECEAAVNECAPMLDKLIEERKPKVFIPMGNVALRRLCGLSGIEDVAGYVLDTKYGIPAIPTYHPSYVMKGNHKLTPSVLFAFKRSQEISNGLYQPSNYELLIDPTAEVVRQYVDSAGERIASLFVDIETPESARLDEEDIEGEGSSFNIIRCGFSVRTNSAVTFPWCQPYISIMQSALERSDEFVEWADNRFDSRRIAAAGLTIPQRIVSAMWVWHWLQSDLRKGLGKVAPFFYCLAAGTRIRLASGRSIKVSDLVTTKNNVTVLGMSKEGTAISTKVVDWHNSQVIGQKWLSIKVAGLTHPLVCTPDHKVWTKSGWKDAIDLSKGDEVKTELLGNNHLIHGTLLGDASVKEHGNLSFSHCDAQGDWAKAKAANFGKAPKRVERYGGFHEGKRFEWEFSTGKVGKHWRELFYKNGKKVFIPPTNDAATAVWYCDDGTLTQTGNTLGIRINTGGFHPRSDVYNWARTIYGKEVSVYGKGTGEVLALKSKGTDIFLERIHRLVHPSMQYKLPPKYRGQYNGWMDKQEFQWSEVEEVKFWEPPKWHRRSDRRYCVTVDDPTHRFFANGVLVSNCGPPWKQRNASDPGLYNALDVVIGRACYEGSKAALSV